MITRGPVRTVCYLRTFYWDRKLITLIVYWNGKVDFNNHCTLCNSWDTNKRIQLKSRKYKTNCVDKTRDWRKCILLYGRGFYFCLAITTKKGYNIFEISMRHVNQYLLFIKSIKRTWRLSIDQFNSNIYLQKVDTELFIENLRYSLPVC